MAISCHTPSTAAPPSDLHLAQPEIQEATWPHLLEQAPKVPWSGLCPMKDTEVLPDISTLPDIFGALYISLLLWWKGDIIQVEKPLSMHQT